MEIPEFLKIAAKDSCLQSKDVIKIFGYTDDSTFYLHVSSGKFPPPDLIGKREGRTGKKFWYAKTIRNEIRKRNKAEAQ